MCHLPCHSIHIGFLLRTRRRYGACAALIMAPVLANFLHPENTPPATAQDAARLQALHGPGGPCRWLLSRLLEWGGASSRFLLLLSCQLSSFLPLQPALVGLYAKEIQMLLLWGTKIECGFTPLTAPFVIFTSLPLPCVCFQLICASET